MNWFLLAGLVSFSVFADTRSVTNTFSFDADQISFSEILPHGQTLKITYTVTPLPLPEITDADLKIAKEMKCISWSYPGTSPDDPGVCGDSAWTGKYRITSAIDEIPLFAVTETITDTRSGKRRVRKLKDISANVYVADSDVITENPQVPSNLSFVSYVQSDFYWNCANETVKTGPVLEDLRVHVAVCTGARGAAKLEKIEGKYRLTVQPELSFRSTMHAFWLVRDYPRGDYLRKRLWPRDPSIEYVLK